MGGRQYVKCEVIELKCVPGDMIGVRTDVCVF